MSRKTKKEEFAEEPGAMAIDLENDVQSDDGNETTVSTKEYVATESDQDNNDDGDDDANIESDEEEEIIDSGDEGVDQSQDDDQESEAADAMDTEHMDEDEMLKMLQENPDMLKEMGIADDASPSEQKDENGVRRKKKSAPAKQTKANKATATKKKPTATTKARSATNTNKKKSVTINTGGDETGGGAAKSKKAKTTEVKSGAEESAAAEDDAQATVGKKRKAGTAATSVVADLKGVVNKAQKVKHDKSSLNIGDFCAHDKWKAESMKREKAMIRMNFEYTKQASGGLNDLTTLINEASQTHFANTGKLVKTLKQVAKQQTALITKVNANKKEIAALKKSSGGNADLTTIKDNVAKLSDALKAVGSPRIVATLIEQLGDPKSPFARKLFEFMESSELDGGPDSESEDEDYGTVQCTFGEDE